jgi:hypothetical protein
MTQAPVRTACRAQAALAAQGKCKCYKTFYFFHTDERAKQAKVFVPCKPYQPGLITVCNGRSLPKRGAPEKCSTKTGSDFTTNIRLGKKGLPRTNTNICGLFVIDIKVLQYYYRGLYSTTFLQP